MRTCGTDGFGARADSNRGCSASSASCLWWTNYSAYAHS